jgi:PAX-interacting protein 1
MLHEKSDLNTLIIDAQLQMLKFDSLDCRDKIRITTPDPNTHRKIVRILEAKKMPWNSFDKEEEKPLKVVIRGIPEPFELKVISEELTKLGFPIKNVQRMRKGPGRSPLSLVLLDVEKSEKGKEIYNLDKLLTLSIKVESLRKKTEAGQCHNCQQWGHSNKNCHAPPKCVKCGQNHRSETCKYTREVGPATCANCGGPHPANFKGCIANPNSQNNQNTRRPAYPNQRHITQRQYQAWNGPTMQANTHTSRPAPLRPAWHRAAYPATPMPLWHPQGPQWPYLQQANPQKQPLLQTPPAYQKPQRIQVPRPPPRQLDQNDPQVATLKNLCSGMEKLLKQATASLASIEQINY